MRGLPSLRQPGLPGHGGINLAHQERVTGIFRG